MRIRTIKPEFFTHELLFDAERETKLPVRLGFAGLWCAADREGRFKWEPRRLGVSILPYDNIDFSRVLDALLTRGLLVKYRVGDGWFGAIPSWKKHQFVNPRETVSCIPDVSVAEELDASSTREARDDHASRKERKGKEGEGKEHIPGSPDASASPSPPAGAEPPAEGQRFVLWFIELLQVTGVNPSLTPTVKEEWATCYERLLRIDGKTKEEIKAVCTWARHDPFWRKNFFSPMKLRDKKDGITYFEAFRAKMAADGQGRLIDPEHFNNTRT